jgi:hypothetical protein
VPPRAKRIELSTIHNPFALHSSAGFPVSTNSALMIPVTRIPFRSAKMALAST